MKDPDKYWPVVVGNLKKARKSWARLPRTLGMEGGNTRVSGMFFKAVVQVIIIFWAETWVMTPCMGRVLGGFQHMVAQRITGGYPWRLLEGSWE